MASKATGADTSGANGSARQRDHHDGSSGRAFTIEQKSAVIRIRKCSPTAFYDILGLEERKTEVSDGEIKKAYRKLSLLTHPDKNGYEGADEAFKMVSRAFTILSDPDKKSRFDKFGGDPDSRFGGGSSAAASSPFSGFARSPSGGMGGSMFEEEISPEEIFRQFFGGGMGGFGGPFGGGFDTGPGFVFNMGGPGIRVHQFGGGRPRRRPHNHAGGAQGQQEPQPSLLATFGSLLPLLLLFVLPLLSSFVQNLGSSPAGPTFRFDAATPPHTLQHKSNRLGVHYFVNPAEVADYNNKKWRELDKQAEGRFLRQLDRECEIERDQQRRLFNEAQGIFWNDEDMLQRAREMDLTSCKRLDELGYARW